MKLPKSIFKILIILLLIVQNSFALSKPIPGVGIVVKRNPGGGTITVITGNQGGFFTQLQEGVYELSFPQDQLQSSINGIIKSNFPKSSYKYDGSGVEMVLDNSQITVSSKASAGSSFAVDEQNSITITVPKGGATLSGKLSWNDAVMTNSISCPDGFIMQNGECVPINNTGNQQARTEGKTKGKVKDLGPKSPMITAGNSENNNGPSFNVSLNASGGTSSSPGVDTSFSFNPSLGIAINWKNFGIGLDAGIFNTKPNFDFDGYAALLQNIDFLTLTNTKNNWSSTYFMFGPQYTIPFGPSQNKESGRHTPFHNKLTFTVALKGGLTMNKIPEFSVMDKSTPPKSIASYTAPQDYKTNAFSLKPSIGFAYWIKENFALTANANYLMQIGQKEFTTGYIDLTNVNLAPPVSPDQFQKSILTAPKVMTNTKGPENYMSFGFGITYSFRKGWDGSIKGNTTVENTNNETQRKGWDGSIKGNKTVETSNDENQRKGIRENGLKKNDFETTTDETQSKSVHATGLQEEIRDNGLTKNDFETTPNETQRKGITEGGLPKNDVETATNEAELKQIAETLVNFRKGWDGSIKGNKVKNEANVKAIAETLVNVARKGWDGSIKGNKIENVVNEADVKTITETLVNIRKGWDGSIKGNIVENIAHQAEVKSIAETFVNLRKGWDGSIKGKNIAEKGINENGLKKNDLDVFKISSNFASNKNESTIPPKQIKNNQLDNSTNSRITKEINPNDNAGGPASQIYGYEEICYELCIQFTDNQGGSIGYGSAVCFISTSLCDEDMGAIANSGNHIYIPKLTEKLNDLPINLLLRSTTKDGLSLKNKEFIIQSDTELPEKTAGALNCEKAFLTAGNYTYNENNAVEIPLKMVGRKGWIEQ